MKISIIIGTRPEIIKMSPVINECIKRDIDFFIVHSGQHYSYEMDEIFFSELNLPKPRYNLEVGSAPHGNQTGNIMIKLEPVIEKENPDFILVQGDTNTVLASALVASKLGIKIGHVEAGLRSYDRKMPEETNRIVTDHISDYLFAPTEESKSILLKEGIESAKIHVTGNTIVDAVYENMKIADHKYDILGKLGIKKNDYCLVTIHRSNNVDIKENYEAILKSLGIVAENYPYQLIWPLHPRSKKALENHNLKIPDKIRIIEPVGYLEFIQLEKNSRLIFTDSGGIQEESCILGIPCLTYRENTERPETLNVGSNVLVGVKGTDIMNKIKDMEGRKKWKNPFGNGASSKMILDALKG